MGFRQDAYATVWSVEDKGKFSKVQLSTSRKNRETNEYETDFSGFVAFVGNAHKKAGSLRKNDRIKLDGCDVTTTYDEKKKITYTNYTVFDFATANSTRKTSSPVDNGEPDDDTPF